jgi:hypothetical protein
MWFAWLWIDQGGESSSTNWSAMRNTLPPLYVDKIEQTEEDIRKIQLKS